MALKKPRGPLRCCATARHDGARVDELADEIGLSDRCTASPAS